jgi:hypothetical protein
MEDYNTEQLKVSKINAAGLTNIVIIELWKDSYVHSRKGEFSKWNADLNCLWVEFGGDLSEDIEEDRKVLKEFEEIDLDLAKIGSITTKKITGFEAVSKDEGLKKAKQYQLLMKKALFLKRLQNKQGKGTAYKEESDDWE